MIDSKDLEYGAKAFNDIHCLLYVKCAIKNVSSALATITPYSHLTENIQKKGISLTSNMLFVLRIRALPWAVIPMPPNKKWPEEQWIDALDLGEELSEKLTTQVMIYQNTYPEVCIQYQLFEAGEDEEYFSHTTTAQALCGCVGDTDYEDSIRDPQGWVNKAFIMYEIADLQIDYEMIIRNLSETGFGGKEIDKLKCEITRIDAVY